MTPEQALRKVEKQGQMMAGIGRLHLAETSRCAERVRAKIARGEKLDQLESMAAKQVGL